MPITPQPGKPIKRLVGIRPHPRHDRPHGAPGDPHQLTHRGFRTRHGQPGHRVIEGVGMPGVVACPRHRDHRRPMSGAVDTPAPRPPASPAPCPNPGPRHRRRPVTAVIEAAPEHRSGRTDPPPRFAAGPGPRPMPPRRPVPELNPLDHAPAIDTQSASRNSLALRTSLLASWFLTFDKPET